MFVLQVAYAPKKRILLVLLLSDHFQEVAWRQVYDALHEVTRMFQIWACKQVTNIAGVNSNQVVC